MESALDRTESPWNGGAASTSNPAAEFQTWGFESITRPSSLCSFRAKVQRLTFPKQPLAACEPMEALRPLHPHFPHPCWNGTSSSG